MNRQRLIEIANECGFDAHDMSDDFTCNLENIESLAAAILQEAAAVCLLQGETKGACDAHFDVTDWCHSALIGLVKDLTQ